MTKQDLCLDSGQNKSKFYFTLTTEQISRRDSVGVLFNLYSRRGGSGMTPSYSSASWLKGAWYEGDRCHCFGLSAEVAAVAGGTIA